MSLRIIDPKFECTKCQTRKIKIRTNLNVYNVDNGMADYVAAINIGARAAVKQLIVVDLTSSYKPSILIGGS
ncbi:MAG: hypothetical protein WAM14_13330 [Candidatus Nitrosopolaris sp.]